MNQMNAKKLDQSVLKGLPKEYRWAAVSETGLAFAYTSEPNLVESLNRFFWVDEISSGKKFIGDGFDATHWRSSKIERQDVPTSADIDWSKAPEGATHYNTLSKQWFAVFDNGKVMRFDGEYWSQSKGCAIALDFGGSETIKRPESITDVARSIEAARVEEKAAFNVSHFGGTVQKAHEQIQGAIKQMAEKMVNDRMVKKSEDALSEIGCGVEARNAIQIADAATQHMRDRAATYDQPEGERSMCRAVDAFNTITGRDLAESEGWLLLQLLKDVRQWSRDAYHQDSAEDCIAYAALKAEALERGR